MINAGPQNTVTGVAKAHHQPQVWPLYLLHFSVFGLSMLHQPRMSAGWQWDTGNALGLLGFAGLLYLFLAVGSGRRQRLHQWTSYAVAAALAAHVLWLWIPDPTLWHYVSIQAPAYMWAGIAALLCVGATVWLALPAARRGWHRGYAAFQTWHYLLSLSAVVLALWHILGSGFYVSALESYLYAALTILVLAAHRAGFSLPADLPPRHLWAGPGLALAFVVFKHAAAVA